MVNVEDVKACVGEGFGEVGECGGCGGVHGREVYNGQLGAAGGDSAVSTFCRIVTRGCAVKDLGCWPDSHRVKRLNRVGPLSGS